MEAHILVVDDDAAIRELVREYLIENDFKVSMAETGAEMDKVLATSEMVDLVILDLKLPDEDGLAIARRLRESLDLPIIILTGRKEEVDRVMGLELGADDYVTKPYSARELIARVRAVLRRGGEVGGDEGTPGVLSAGPVRMDVERHVVAVDGEQVPLPLKEFDLLEYLMRNAGRVVSKTSILSHVWGYDFDPNTNVVDVLVSRLRDRVDKPFAVKLLHTVRGVGYVLRPPS
jgi:two-component system response regulator RegX3